MVQPVTTPTVPFNTPAQSAIAPRPTEQERTTGVRGFTQDAVTEAEEREALQADEDDQNRFQAQAAGDRQASAERSGRGQRLDIVA